jgi:hypothetical protein
MWATFVLAEVSFRFHVFLFFFQCCITLAVDTVLVRQQAMKLSYNSSYILLARATDCV